MKARAWRESVTIPTYRAGDPDRNPVFLENRVYQGSCGAVYPYPVIESVADEKEDVSYDAVFLENEYIKVMVLPQLGGRVQTAYDKIAGRHFIYCNRVIKPALVGLAGPWISGGIEFNWPQHHRPSTFMPVDSDIVENPDGSATVVCNEMERMFGQRAQTSLTLRPGCAYLEIKGVLCNRSQLPQTFLWWANPAVHVNDAYQSVFPTDVHAVFDHGKRAVSTFPIATGTYYKVDYSAGVDISNYRNIPVPTSYMIAKSKYDFEGGYENDTECGMLHVADHNVSPGKKQWTWGNGDFGRAWDRNLTDEDGPYIELMAGVYTENQPDFTWIMPGEEKAFVQYFMPYRKLGIVKNACRDLVLNMLPAGDGVRIMVFATSSRKVRISLRSDDGRIFLDTEENLSPEKLFDMTVDTKGAPFETLTVSAGNLSWHKDVDDGKIPPAAEAALRPSEIATCEQLYLTGLHLEQYRHATWKASDYYEEALKRDPSDVRNNNAMGLWYLRRGCFGKAEPYFRKAVSVLQKRNLNPYDGEPLYNLGICLKYLGRINEAYTWLYKSTWNAAWQEAGYLECARISLMRGNLEDALWQVERSLVRNWHNHQARALKCAVLRKLGRTEESLQFAADSLTIDRFNYGCRWERILMGAGGEEEFVSLMRDEPHNYDELGLDYLSAGLDEEASALWSLAGKRGAASTMSFYYRKDYTGAKSSSPDYVFPNRLEDVNALTSAPSDDAMAPYLLGCFYYAKGQHETALGLWERSSSLDPSYPTVWRNLALAYNNFSRDGEKALAAMERAFSLDMSDARVFMELDQLYKRTGKSAQFRMDLFRRHMDLVYRRDDLVLELATLHSDLGEPEKAKEIIDSRKFHPWEGGEGKVTAQYQRCRIMLAEKALDSGNPSRAIAIIEECYLRPYNLGEGKLVCAQEQDLNYFLGKALQASGDAAGASACFEKAASGDLQPVPALYYNDTPPEKIYFQGLALHELGRDREAEEKFRMLLDYGNVHMDDKPVMDYFAVSLPDLAVWDEDLSVRNRRHCSNMIGLGRRGLSILE